MTTVDMFFHPYYSIIKVTLIFERQSEKVYYWQQCTGIIKFGQFSIQWLHHNIMATAVWQWQRKVVQIRPHNQY